MSRFELYCQELRDQGLDLDTIDLDVSDLETVSLHDLGSSNFGVGEKGADGVSVVSVEQIVTSAEPDVPNVIRITLSNDRVFDFEVRNGRDYILTDDDRNEIVGRIEEYEEPIPDNFIDELFTK